MRPFLNQFKLLRQLDRVLVAAVLLLMAVGVLSVCSAGHTRVETALLYQKQILWGVIGAIAFVFFVVFDYRSIRSNAWWLYGAALVLLVVVLLVGEVIYGARRWLMLLGVGLQPSEFAKLAIILTLAWYLGGSGADLRSIRTLVFVLALVGVPVLLVMKEPDLGTAMVMVPVSLAMMFVGGVNGKYLSALLLTGVTVVVLVLGALFLPGRLGLSDEAQERAWKYTGLSHYQRQRLFVFFEPQKDPLGAGWNKMQSEIAVGSGGLTGKGYLKGTQNILGFLPRTVAPTDFIFSVIAEETGFVGSATVIALFVVVLVCGMRAAFNARDRIGRLLCVGVTAMLFSHVFVNIAMTVGIMPITGLPLPLISYGGSFMVSTLVGLGLVQSVYVRRHHR